MKENASSTLVINGAGAVINDESSDAIATSEVVLQPGFEATGNSEFRVHILNCVGATLADENTEEPITRQDQLKDGQSVLAVYPTITGGPVHVSTDNSILKDAEIVVSDNGPYRGAFNKQCRQKNSNTEFSAVSQRHLLYSGETGR